MENTDTHNWQTEGGKPYTQRQPHTLNTQQNNGKHTRQPAVNKLKKGGEGANQPSGDGDRTLLQSADALNQLNTLRLAATTHPTN